MYCGSVQDSRDVFMNKLEELLGERFKDFESLSNLERSLYVCSWL